MSFEAMAGGIEKTRKRKKLRSRAEYARTRESIPSIEKLSQESEHAKNVAEISFAIEMEPKVQEKLAKTVNEILPDTRTWKALTTKQQEAVNKKSFTVTVETDSNNNDAVTVQPEGNVAEKIPLNRQLTQTLAASLSLTT